MTKKSQHAITLIVLALFVHISYAQDGPPPARKRIDGGHTFTNIGLLSPNNAISDAATDIISVKASQRHDIRYISFYNIPFSKRPKYIQELSYIVNGLSRSESIDPVYVVPNTQYSLVRVDRSLYQFMDDELKRRVGWSDKALDNLFATDPYFYRAEDEPTGKRTYTSAFWLNQKAYDFLVVQTGTYYPIIRGDFFISNSSLEPHYSEILELGNSVDSLLAALSVDKKVLERLKLAVNGVVVKSGAGLEGTVIPVSDKNRFISRERSFYGYIWRTKDVEKAKDVNDFLRVLRGDVFDASEWIVTARNGLQWYFLSNGKDEWQPEAPITIVRDNTAVDRRVRNGRSCITCHVRGINEFIPQPQELVKNAIDIVTPDKRKSEELKRNFVANVDQFIGSDNQGFNLAVKKATTIIIDGKVSQLSAEQNAALFAEVYGKYNDVVVDLEAASLETGVPVKDLAIIFDMSDKNPHLKGLSRNNKLLAVPRLYWEQSFPEAMELILRYWKP